MTVTAQPAMLAAEGHGCGSTAATPKAVKPRHQAPQLRDHLAGIGWTAAGPGHSV